MKEFSPSIDVQVTPFEMIGDVNDDLLSELIAIRLVDPQDRDAKAVDSFALRDFERRVLADDARARGVPYNGIGLMRFYQKHLKNADMLGPEMHIVITDRLIMTWSDDDLRYHARVAVFGVPCVISVSGLVEAPARPKEYYLAKQALSAIGATDAPLADKFSGRYLEQDDSRTFQVMRGYLLQCLFYALFSDPFCKNKNCMLYNAHWQEDMINVQIKIGRLCNKHSRLLSSLTNSD